MESSWNAVDVSLDPRAGGLQTHGETVEDSRVDGNGRLKSPKGSQKRRSAERVHRSYHTVVSPQYAQSRWDMLGQTLKAVGDEVATKTVFQTTQTYLNESVITFGYLASGRAPLMFETAQESNPQLQSKRIANADFVLAPTPDARDVFAHLPTASS